jgi:hypothetical protein
MTEKHYNLGHFVWRELIAADVEAAKRLLRRAAGLALRRDADG